MKIDGVDVVERFITKGKVLQPCKDEEGNVYVPWVICVDRR